MVNFTVEVLPSGEAVIKFPEGRSKQVDAAKAAKLTAELAKALGKVKERHEGHHHEAVAQQQRVTT